MFNGLEKDIAETLIDRYRKEYQEYMEMEKMLNSSKADIDEIIKTADIETYGARGLKRAVRKQMLVALDRMESKKKEKEVVSV